MQDGIVYNQHIGQAITNSKTQNDLNTINDGKGNTNFNGTDSGQDMKKF